MDECHAAQFASFETTNSRDVKELRWDDLLLAETRELLARTMSRASGKSSMGLTPARETLILRKDGIEHPV